jgi:hypothetical protein
MTVSLSESYNQKGMSLIRIGKTLPEPAPSLPQIHIHLHQNSCFDVWIWGCAAKQRWGSVCNELTSNPALPKRRLSVMSLDYLG